MQIASLQEFHTEIKIINGIFKQRTVKWRKKSHHQSEKTIKIYCMISDIRVYEMHQEGV